MSCYVADLVGFGALALVALHGNLGCGDDGGATDDAGVDAPLAPDAAVDASVAPYIVSITPDTGPAAGGTVVLISGGNFEAPGAGTTTVMFDTGVCTDMSIINDLTIQCTTPPGLPSAVAVVEVSNNHGTATSTFQYSTGIYAADGKTGQDGNLYVLDPATGESTVIGPIGYAITGLAFAPDGTLYGSQATQSGNRGNASLIVIDTTTGAGTPVGELLDSTTGIYHNSTADIAFHNDTLLGWSETGDDPVTIDTTTGAVSVIGDSGVSSSGSGIAVDTEGVVWFVPGRVNGNLYIINPMTGIGFEGPALTGGTYDNINSLTFLNGTLYGVDTQDLGSTSSLQVLITIDTATGAITPIGPIPTGIDAIASPSR